MFICRLEKIGMSSTEPSYQMHGCWKHGCLPDCRGKLHLHLYRNNVPFPGFAAFTLWEQFVELIRLYNSSRRKTQHLLLSDAVIENLKNEFGKIKSRQKSTPNPANITTSVYRLYSCRKRDCVSEQSYQRGKEPPHAHLYHNNVLVEDFGIIRVWSDFDKLMEAYNIKYAGNQKLEFSSAQLNQLAEQYSDIKAKKKGTAFTMADASGSDCVQAATRSKKSAPSKIEKVVTLASPVLIDGIPVMVPVPQDRVGNILKPFEAAEKKLAPEKIKASTNFWVF
jgi:hypothetical protein